MRSDVAECKPVPHVWRTAVLVKCYDNCLFLLKLCCESQLHDVLVDVELGHLDLS